MSARLSPEREAEIAARAEAATPGPWKCDPDGVLGSETTVAEVGGCERIIGCLYFGDGDDADADREFTHNAREDVDTLLAELKAERADNSQLYSDLTGANLARWEEENDARRARLAATNARKRGARLLAELAAVRAELAEAKSAAHCQSVAAINGTRCALPIRHRGDHQNERRNHYWSDEFAAETEVAS